MALYGAAKAPAIGKNSDGSIVEVFVDNSTGTASNTIAAATNTGTLTDATTGTADLTLSPVVAGGTGAAAGGWDSAANRNTSITNINNNFKEVHTQYALQKTLNTVLINAVASLTQKIDELIVHMNDGRT